MRSALKLVLVAALCLAASRAGADQRLQEARRQYLNQEYERVIKLLSPLVSSPASAISDKVEAYELLGLSYLILGEPQSAREAFENLLGLDPGHVLRDPSGSPKLRKFFESVKESFVPGYQPSAPVNLEHAAPSAAVAGRPVEFGAVVAQGAREVGEMLLLWRRAGMISYESLRMKRQQRSMAASFLLPADAAGYRLEYYLEARSSAGQVVARIGSPERPLALEVAGLTPPVRSVPIYKRWWFWTVIGAVAVGGATVAGVMASRETAPQGNLGPGILQLP